VADCEDVSVRLGLPVGSFVRVAEVVGLNDCDKLCVGEAVAKLRDTVRVGAVSSDALTDLAAVGEVVNVGSPETDADKDRGIVADAVADGPLDRDALTDFAAVSETVVDGSIDGETLNDCGILGDAVPVSGCDAVGM
jgi:hypothetical protein